MRQQQHTKQETTTISIASTRFKLQHLPAIEPIDMAQQWYGDRSPSQSAVLSGQAPVALLYAVYSEPSRQSRQSPHTCHLGCCLACAAWQVAGLLRMHCAVERDVAAPPIKGLPHAAWWTPPAALGQHDSGCMLPPHSWCCRDGLCWPHRPHWAQQPVLRVPAGARQAACGEATVVQAEHMPCAITQAQHAQKGMQGRADQPG